MIRFETTKPVLDEPKAAIYEFAKKHRLSDKEAERLFQKLGASATPEAMLAEARLPAPKAKSSTAEVKES
jgi:hypothetical protein